MTLGTTGKGWPAIHAMILLFICRCCTGGMPMLSRSRPMSPTTTRLSNMICNEETALRALHKGHK